jgi:hypothetical protein
VQLRKSSRPVSVVVIAILSAACNLLSSGDRTWSEEVALDDGSVITIDRHVEQFMSHALGGGAFSATETASTLTFRGDLAAIPRWGLPLMPLLLYRDPESAEWVIVATTTICEVWYARGMPKPHYWEFRLRGTEWVEVPLSETSYGRNTNLLFEYTEPLPAKHITLATKAQLQSRDQSQRFRVVQRGVRRCAPLTGR